MIQNEFNQLWGPVVVLFCSLLCDRYQYFVSKWSLEAGSQAWGIFFLVSVNTSSHFHRNHSTSRFAWEYITIIHHHALIQQIEKLVEHKDWAYIHEYARFTLYLFFLFTLSIHQQWKLRAGSKNVYRTPFPQHREARAWAIVVLRPSCKDKSNLFLSVFISVRNC